MPDINGRLIANTTPLKKTHFTNEDVLKPKQGLSINVEQSPSMRAMVDPYANEPSIDSLLAAAHKTLDSTDSLSNLSAQRAHADIASAAEESNLRDQQQQGYQDAGNNVLAAGSFIPGPIGMGARALDSAVGLYKLNQEGPGEYGGNVMRAGGSLWDILPALKALRTHPMEGVSPRVTGQGAESAYRMAEEAAPARSQKLLMENNPLEGEIVQPKQLGSGARPMPASPDPSYVRAVQGEYPQSMQALSAPEADITGELNALGEQGLSSDEIALARAKERFGRNFHDEGGMPHWGPQEAPVTPPPTRGLSAGEERGIDDLGRVKDFIHGEDAAPKGNGLFKEPSIASMATPGELQRQSALDALADESSIGFAKKGKTPIAHSSDAQKNVLFGGATSQTEGTHGEYVRPKHRHPIGSGSPRVTPREKNVTWNQ